MGIFDFFRKIAKTGNVEEIVIEKLAFSEIKGWIERKIKENELKEKEILLGVGKTTEIFIKELREKIVILENFDVEARKEKEDIKNIVIDSREKYIEFLEDLIKRLNDLEEPKLEKFTGKINKIFFDFNKSAIKNYERATILIGKEMGSIKESLKVFSKDLLKTFKEGKSITDSFKNLLIIKEKLSMINQIDETLGRINGKKSNLNKKIIEKEEENRILKQSLEKIKTSSAYLENLTKQKEIESLKEKSKKNILELKQLIDFKALANFFHIFEEQMIIVKTHKEDFQTNFQEDDGKAIIRLLDEAKLSNDLILEKLKQIRGKIEETLNHKKNLKKDETQEVYLKIKEVSLEIDNLKIEKVKEEKREEKLRANKEESITSLKQELGKMNVEVV
ncbi:MAG TPA: hypothetical protein ENG87_04725 [Candidatus Pacearchaeota archaeon]|nr:hypothetical protein BMS3Abin17_01178 [archaeon BMS3Abin17]HDK42661.1 hypothetical protein [Candidatus Pacearchaeota archaeon]HDZ60396.1 hypothetical protein [Candidatus Pacearchaeota archaeon]